MIELSKINAYMNEDQVTSFPNYNLKSHFKFELFGCNRKSFKNRKIKEFLVSIRDYNLVITGRIKQKF